MTRMTSKLNIALIASLILTASIAATAQAQDFEDGDYQRANTWGGVSLVVRSNDSAYYPQSQTYSSRDRQRWDWDRGNDWQQTTRFGDNFSLGLRGRTIPINRQTESYYPNHNYVDRSYDRQWRTARDRHWERDQQIAHDDYHHRLHAQRHAHYESDRDGWQWDDND